MFKKYYLVTEETPYFNLFQIISDISTDIAEKYPKVFKYLHSLKRFNIKQAYVGDDSTLLNDISIDDYVNYINADNVVTPLLVEDKFKNITYRVGEKVMIKHPDYPYNDYKKISKFIFHDNLYIYLDDGSHITDLKEIIKLNCESGCFYDIKTSAEGKEVHYLKESFICTEQYDTSIELTVPNVKLFSDIENLMVYYINNEITLTLAELKHLNNTSIVDIVFNKAMAKYHFENHIKCKDSFIKMLKDGY